MGVVFARPPMGRPARVANADMPGKGLFGQATLQVLELAEGPSARQMPVFQSGNSRRIIAAVFEAL